MASAYLEAQTPLLPAAPAASRAGFFGAILRDRPIFIATIVIIGVAALAAVALRRAPTAAAIGHGVFLVSFWAALAIPPMVASLAPTSAARRGVLVIALAAAAILAPFLSPMAPFFWDTDYIAILQVVLIASGALTLIKPIIAPELRLHGMPLLAAPIGTVASIAFYAAGLLAEWRLGPATPVIIVVSSLLAVHFLLTLINAFGREFAKGGATQQALGRATDAAAPYAMFVLLLTVVALAANGVRLGVASGFADGGAVTQLFALCAAPILVTFFVGGALIALRPTGDTIAFEANRRRVVVRNVTAQGRRILPASSGVAAMAIIAIVAVVAAFDRSSPLWSGVAVISLIAGACAAAAFISFRAGVLLGVVAMALTLILDWLIGLIAAPLRPVDEIALILLATSALAPIVLNWREERDPWRKSADVARLVVAEQAPSFLIILALWPAGLCAAAASGYWPEAYAVASRLVVYLAAGFVAVSIYMVGFGALLGRER